MSWLEVFVVVVVDTLSFFADSADEKLKTHFEILPALATRLDPDPYSDFRLSPDSYKTNADPKHWRYSRSHEKCKVVKVY